MLWLLSVLLCFLFLRKSGFVSVPKKINKKKHEQLLQNQQHWQVEAEEEKRRDDEKGGGGVGAWQSPPNKVTEEE